MHRLSLLRKSVDEEIAKWDGIARSSKSLVDQYDRALKMTLLDVSNEFPSEPTGRSGSLQRFTPFVTEVAERLIRARGGPVSIEDIFAGLPAEVREYIKKADSQFSPLYRVRRMLRRSKKYVVSERGVSLAGLDQALPRTATITTMILSKDGTLAFELTDDDGGISLATPAQVRNALRSGAQFRLSTSSGRESYLRSAGGRFYSTHQNSENSDYAMLPKRWTDS